MSELLRRVSEATCQGCESCKFGGTFPCPSQTPVWYEARVRDSRPEWVKRMEARENPAKELTR